MIRIRPRARGPLAVELEGPCEVYGVDGTLLDLGGRTRILLCRCGHSQTAPICDGSHYRTDFEKPPAPPGDGTSDATDDSTSGATNDAQASSASPDLAR